MSFNITPQLQAYNDGLEELFYVNKSFALLAQGMGQPVWSRSGPTAYVEFVPSEGKIRFAFNPDFILSLSTEEVAGIIGHEAHHVVLEHLKEASSGEYENAQALYLAQEAIINDTITTVFRLPLPDGVVRGPDLVGMDTTPFSSRQVYDLILKPKPEEEEDKSDSKDKSEDKDESEKDKSKSEDDSESDSDQGDSDKDDSGESDSGEEEASGDDEGDSDKGSDDGDADGGSDGEGEGEGNGSGSGDSEGQGNQSGGESGQGPGGQPGDTDGGEKSGEGPSAKDTEDRDDLVKEPEQAKGDRPGQDGSDKDGSEKPGEGETKTCGGVVVPEGSSAKDIAKAVAEAVKAGANEGGMTPAELVNELVNDNAGGFSLTGVDLSQVPAMTAERMNWRKLLAKINPKVLESGRPRKKSRNNWTSYNRRMGSVYPRVILPKSEVVEPKKADDSGDTLPVVVIALDLSGSIPRHLVGTLQGLLNEIPEKLIKAYPCTWASYCVPYVAGTEPAHGGTEINSVVQYVDQVKRETNTDPYVLVISDGEFPRDHRRPGKEWFFMAVDKSSVTTMTKGMRGYGRNMGGQVKPGEECYLVDDFKI